MELEIEVRNKGVMMERLKKMEGSYKKVKEKLKKKC